MPHKKILPKRLSHAPIVFVASEGVPFIKTGGLADVVGALPKALASKNRPIWIFLPLYRAIQEQHLNLEPTGIEFKITVAGHVQHISLWKTMISSHVTAWLVEADKYFDRDGIYGATPGTDYPDNDARYAVFSRAVVEGLKAIGTSPWVIHAHDWQTGLIPAHLKTLHATDRFFSDTATVFTIHNMAYQGIFPESSLRVTGLPHSTFTISGVEYYGRVNYLKSGIVYADAISTVSPTYAEEILKGPEFGHGLEGLLRSRQPHLTGIVNGLDVQYWNPVSDEFLRANYSSKTLKKRAECKADLQRSLKIKEDPAIPLLGFIGRLDRQKGIDTLLDIAPQLVRLGCQLVFLGVGDRFLHAQLQALENRFPKAVHVEDGFAESKAHKIYAGADIFLMPSKYEPCGLGQLIAMRYGCVPVVTPTGGLLDTVLNESAALPGTGFVAANLSSLGFLDAIKRALVVFQKPAAWQAIQKRAMRKDSSWGAAVPQYFELYQKARRHL